MLVMCVSVDGDTDAGYRHVQLRSSSNQPLDLSTLFICCKLEDDSVAGQAADGVSAAAMGDWRSGVDAAGSSKKHATRSSTTATVLRPRDETLPTTVDKEVRCTT